MAYSALFRCLELAMLIVHVLWVLCWDQTCTGEAPMHSKSFTLICHSVQKACISAGRLVFRWLAPCCSFVEHPAHLQPCKQMQKVTRYATTVRPTANPNSFCFVLLGHVRCALVSLGARPALCERAEHCIEHHWRPDI